VLLAHLFAKGFERNMAQRQSLAARFSLSGEGALTLQQLEEELIKLQGSPKVQKDRLALGQVEAARKELNKRLGDLQQEIVEQETNGEKQTLDFWVAKEAKKEMQKRAAAAAKTPK
jgi:hypothetical protein